MTTAPFAPRRSRGAGTLTVASVPAGHVYVRHLSPDPDDGPRRLPDPPPGGSQDVGGQRWWPPAMLDPGWIVHHAATFDLFHLHFGFDARSTDELRAVVEALRVAGRPLVYTVHDLRNPHHQDRGAHDAQLDVLVPAADALITLTPGAAAEIRRRWGRDATVVPHPHVVPLDTMRAARSMRDVRRRTAHATPFRVGLHVKSLRASMAPATVLPALVESVGLLPHAVLQVNGHRDVLEPHGQRYDAALASMLQRYADTGRIDLRIHDYFGDDELIDYLASLDVSVLPYRFGTHSGWLEACRDVGTAVVAPTCGYFAEQGPVLTYEHDETSYDAGSLVDAVVHAYRDRPDLGANVQDRYRQRAAVAAAHDSIYRRVAEGSR